MHHIVHAATTERPSTRPDRPTPFEAPIPSDELGRTRRACTEVFENRAAQQWPPTIAVPDGWHAIYKRAFDDIITPIPDLPKEVGPAVALIQEWIAEVDAA